MGETPRKPTKRRGPARYWPVLAVVVVVAAALGVGALVGGEEEEEEAAGGSTSDGIPALAAFPDEDPLDAPDCDRETGRLAIPSVYAPQCVPVWPEDRDNGGATAPGVTEDEIVVAVYLAEASATATAITDEIAGDAAPTDEENSQYRQQIVDAYDDLYETYGREVRIVEVEATGGAADDAAARADAIRIADDIGAFAAIGGPAQTNIYAEELANRGVLCLCVTGQPNEVYEELAPYAWGATMSSTQGYVHRADFVTSQLAGEPAEFAGDPAFRSEERTFAVVYYETAAGDRKAAVDFFADRLAEDGVELADQIPYILDLSRAPEDAATIVARLKDAGVTSVIFAGDPFFPIYLTQEATAQDYRPEWIVTGSTGTDSTAFARRYDQEQWAHAFGISYLLARVDPEALADEGNLVSWYLGKTLPAYPNIFDFGRLFAGIHLAGPELTAETYREAMFAYEPTSGYTTAFGSSYGEVRWPWTDWSGADDVTLVWWDADATGPDEVGGEGTGMYRYVDNGKRYLPGELADATGTFFAEADTFTLLQATPEEDLPPTYEPRTSRTG
ncbi:MAG TPA: hypothetical protein VFI47_00260 [Acidimicrobiales bacterium]|nr:hypothetical protein [Acidimicrobiales bacterium]